MTCRRAVHAHDKTPNETPQNARHLKKPLAECIEHERNPCWRLTVCAVSTTTCSVQPLAASLPRKPSQIVNALPKSCPRSFSMVISTASQSSQSGEGFCGVEGEC